MALYLKRPVASSVLSQSSRLIYLRLFTVVSSRRADDKWGMYSQQPRRPAEKSVKVAAKQTFVMPKDFGIFERTFIYPSSKTRPRLFRNPINFVRFNWFWVKSKVWAALSLTIYKFSGTPLQRPKLRLSQTAPTAMALHSQLYTAIAEGDTNFLRDHCGEGLQQSMQALIRSRPRGERWRWELIKYNQRPKVMMHRASTLPLQDWGIRQAVVRINSKQRLTKYRNLKVVPGSGKDRDTVEYFVMQRRSRKGREEPWYIWGTTEESTLDILEEPEPVITER